MRRRDRLVRLAVGTLLFMGSLTVVVPIGLGRWDPAWLRLAPDVQLDMQQPNLEPGEVRHPFVVEQSDLQGRLRWRLSGAGLRGPSNAVDLLREQSVLEPRLELFAGPKGQTQLKGGAILLTAARARIRVLEAEGKRRVRLDLGPDLVLRQGDLELRGDSLVVWFDPERPTEFQLRAKDSLVITLRGAGPNWRLQAAGVEATSSRLSLAGPVQFSGGPLVGGPLDGFQLEGQAAGAVLSAADGALGGPWRLDLSAPDLRGGSPSLARPSSGSLALAADEARVDFAVGRGPVHAALGGGPGCAPGGRPAPQAILFTGHVRGQFRGAGQDVALKLSGSRLEVQAGQRRAILSGNPAQVVEERAGLSLSARRLSLESPRAAEGQRSPLVIAAEEVESLEFREGPASGAVWRGRAGSLALVLAAEAQAGVAEVTSRANVAAVSTQARALAALDRVRSLQIEGGIELVRTPGPDRFSAESLAFTQAEQAPGAARRVLRASGLAALLTREGSPSASSPARVTSAVAWEIEAGQLDLVTRGSWADLAPISSSESPARPVLPWSRALAALESFEATGGVHVGRRGEEQDPRRRLRKGRGLKAQSLRYSGASGQVRAEGSAILELGALTLRAPALEFDPKGGVLTGRDLNLTLVRLVLGPKGPKQVLTRETYTASAEEGSVALSLDPKAWASERVRRRSRRRAGAALTLPEPLRNLSLVGRVRAKGPRGTLAEASRLRLEGRRVWLSGSPVRLEEERGSLRARSVKVSWREADLAPLASGTRVARDATRARIDASGQVVARGKLGVRRFALECDRASGELFESVGLRQKDPRAPFPLGAFSASGRDGVTLRWESRLRGGGSRDLKLRADRLRGHGRTRDAQGRPALSLRLSGRWATTLALPKGGLAQVSGGTALAWIDPASVRLGAVPKESEEAYLRRLLRGLTITGGVRLAASGLEARAESARLDPERGGYVLKGEPVVIRRGGLRQTMREAVIRLSDE